MKSIKVSTTLYPGLWLRMHQVNIGQLQEPFSPNFEFPDFYLMCSHMYVYAALLMYMYI